MKEYEGLTNNNNREEACWKTDCRVGEMKVGAVGGSGVKGGFGGVGRKVQGRWE